MSALPAKADIGERDRQERRTVRFTLTGYANRMRAFFNLHGTYWRQTLHVNKSTRIVMPPEIRSAGSKLESRSCADCSLRRRGVTRVT